MELTIENFGPVKKGRIKTKKVTVLIGNQGSGKSTVAKLLSTCCWIEKYIYRYGYTKEIEDEIINKFNDFWDYHRLSNYLKRGTHITYAGSALRIDFKNWADGKSTIKPINNAEYSLPKITYFPAERNFLSSIKKSKQGQDFTLWSQSLQEFKEIFQDAKDSIKGHLKLPINDIDVEYDNFKEVLYIKGTDYKIPLSESASGFQSFVPMYVVVDYLSKMLQSEYKMSSGEREIFKKQSAEILSNPAFTDEQKKMLLSTIASKINIKRTINIIEEPEQNLFPESQRSMLNSILGFNNEVKDNELIITTHSPYILSYLMLAVKAAELKEKAKGNAEILSKIYRIVPDKAITPIKDVVIYELDDDGTISELKQVYGLPSNDNYLSNELGEVNTVFSELMDIEDLCGK